MLSIGDVLPKVWVPHEDTKTKFLIKPVEPKDAQRILREARDEKTGDLNNVKYNGLAAEHMIEDWEGVGADGVASPCTPENRIKFGERFGRIVAFLMDRATDAKIFSDEAKAGKNV